jgi:hypothetical protein
MRTRHAIALAALAASGCTWGPEMSVSAVLPASVVRDEAVIVRILGDGFAPEVVVDFDDATATGACGFYVVELSSPGQASVRLGEAVRISARELRGRLPAGLSKVPWNVTVIAPGGGEASLPGGLEVADCATAAAPCDDGNPCTAPDLCLGASGCADLTPLPDGTPCAVDCTTGVTVDGTCVAGVCAGATCPTVPSTCDEG